MLACVSTRAPDDPRSLIGKPLPERRRNTWRGWEYGDHALVRGGAPAFGAVTWGRGPESVLFLTLIEGANTPTRRETVLDAVLVKTIQGAFISMQCELAEKADPEIAAHVISADSQWYTDVRQAWRFDLANRTIIEIPARGVRCVNESFGIGED